MPNTCQALHQELLNARDSTPEKAAMFFKTKPGDYAEHDKFLGITVPTLRKLANQYQTITLDDLGSLIQSPYNEERLLALIILVNQYTRAEDHEKKIIYEWYKNHMKFVNNWNLVDSSAHLILGAYLYEYPEHQSLLDVLADSSNLWERRIAIVSTWYFIRQSHGDLTYHIATRLLNDPHDLIHKAVGWMLREAGKKDEPKLIAYLDVHSDHMPRTMLRYATERL